MTKNSIVHLAELGSKVTTENDLITYSNTVALSKNTNLNLPEGSGINTKNGLGTAGQVLTSSGNDVYWGASGGGSGNLMSIDNIASLRATPVVTTTDYIVDGYYTPGDGGGGQFYGVTGGSYTDNGGSIIVPGGGSGNSAWLRVFDNVVNIKWFGAKSDGITEASAALIAAIDSIKEGGKIIFPSGKFYFNQAIWIKPGISLLGPYESFGQIGNNNPGLYKVGANMSAIVFGPGGNFVQQGGTCVSGFFIRRDNLDFTNPDASSWTGVALQGLSGLTLSVNSATINNGTIKFTYTGSGNFFVGSYMTVALDGSPNYSGIYRVTEFDSTTFTAQINLPNGSWSGNGKAIRSGDDVTVKNCFIVGFNIGMYMNGVQRLTVSDLKMDNLNCIFVDGTSDIDRFHNIHCWPYATIGANVFKPFANWWKRKVGFRIKEADFPEFTNCFAFGYCDNGFLFEGTGTATVVNCHVDSNDNNTCLYGMSFYPSSGRPCAYITLTNCSVIAQNTAFYVKDPNAIISFVNCAVGDPGSYGFSVESGQTTIIGGFIGGRSGKTGINNIGGTVYAHGVGVSNVMSATSGTVTNISTPTIPIRGW